MGTEICLENNKKNYNFQILLIITTQRGKENLQKKYCEICTWHEKTEGVGREREKRMGGSGTVDGRENRTFGL